MADTQTRIQQNAALGASLTECILLKSFWVLKRSVDIDGADFLIQQRDDAVGNPRRRPLALGLVQAKFFEVGTQVRIARSYVEDQEGPRPDFFAFLHTTDDLGETTTYFFPSEDIVRTWGITKCGGYFYFSLTKDREFSEHRNRSQIKIAEVIVNGLARTKEHQTRFMLRSFFDLYVDTRNLSPEPHRITYMLRIVEGCKVVVYQDVTADTFPRPLEPRRDLFPYSGDFSWGYSGMGPMFLAASILGHYFGGTRSPTIEQQRTLVATISRIPEDQPFDIRSEDIDALLEYPNTP